MKSGKKSLKAHVEIQRPDDGSEDQIGLFVQSQDGRPLTGNQIVEAVAEAVLLYWDNNPLEARCDEDYDA